MVVFLLLAALLPDPISSVLYGSRFLTGEVGGSVTHQCFYAITPANIYDRKYWCKIAESRACYTVISTSGYTARGYEGRVSLQDVPQNGTFTVTMTQLKTSDAGAYRCGVGISNAGLFVRQQLVVLEAGSAPRPVQLVLGERRGSVAVRCPPGGVASGRRAFWCKWGKSGCALIADTDGYVGRGYEGRIFVKPPESSGAFKILINDLKREDSGVYGCGTGMPSGTDSPGTVELRVTAASAVPRRPKFLSGAVGGSLSLQCRYDPRRSYEKKYVCRWEAGRCSPLADADGFVHGSYAGRMQIAGDDRENGTFTVVMSNLREDDAGWYWCGAKSGHAEQTSPVKLRIQGETWSSRGPETSTAVDPTSSSTPAAYSTTTQRSVTGQTYTEGGDVHGESTSALVSVLRSTTFETSRREIYRGSASSESHLLSVVLPALVGLLLITVAILVLTKIRLRRETGRERSAPGSLEAADLDPVKEPTMEKTMSPEKLKESKTDSGESRMTYAILGRFRQTNLSVSVSVFQQG